MTRYIICQRWCMYKKENRKALIEENTGIKMTTGKELTST